VKRGGYTIWYLCLAWGFCIFGKYLTTLPQCCHLWVTKGKQWGLEKAISYDVCIFWFYFESVLSRGIINKTTEISRVFELLLQVSKSMLWEKEKETIAA